MDYLKISDTHKLLQFINKHKLVAFDVVNCNQCRHSTYNSMKIGYSNYKPISKRTYNKLKKIMHIPKNDKTAPQYIDVNQLVQFGYIEYIGSCKSLSPCCNNDEDGFSCDTCIYNNCDNCKCDDYNYCRFVGSNECNSSTFECDDYSPDYIDSNVDNDFIDSYWNPFD